MKTLRNCCGCVVFAIFLLLVACIVLTWLVLSTRTAHAQAPRPPCISAALEQVIQITERIAPPPPSDVARGVFFERRLTMNLRGGECILLASTPDGRGIIWVDDEVRMEIMRPDGSTRSWSYDFRNTERTQVVPTAPQELSTPFTRGEHHLHVVLQDLSPTVYGASSLWLVVFATATPTPTDAGIQVGTPTATAEPSPTLTQAPTLTPLPQPLAAIPTPAASIASPTPSNPIPMVVATGGMALLGLLVASVARRRARQAPPTETPFFAGTLNVSNRETFELLTLELVDWQSGFAIVPNPLRVERRQDAHEFLVCGTPCAEGVRVESRGNDEPLVLRRGDSTQIGTLKLSLEG